MRSRSFAERDQGPSNDSMQRTTLRVAADAERWAARLSDPGSQDGEWLNV
jgi:hypothetical protein